jgi:hypothetical protein
MLVCIGERARVKGRWMGDARTPTACTREHRGPASPRPFVGCHPSLVILSAAARVSGQGKNLHRPRENVVIPSGARSRSPPVRGPRRRQRAENGRGQSAVSRGEGQTPGADGRGAPERSHQPPARALSRHAPARSPVVIPSAARNRDRPERGPSTGRIAIPRLRGRSARAPLGMTPAPSAVAVPRSRSTRRVVHHRAHYPIPTPWPRSFRSLS